MSKETLIQIKPRATFFSTLHATSCDRVAKPVQHCQWMRQCSKMLHEKSLLLFCYSLCCFNVMLTSYWEAAVEGLNLLVPKPKLKLWCSSEWYVTELWYENWKKERKKKSQFMTSFLPFRLQPDEIWPRGHKRVCADVPQDRRGVQVCVRVA